jgi:hypothetical protein
MDWGLFDAAAHRDWVTLVVFPPTTPYIGVPLGTKALPHYEAFPAGSAYALHHHFQSPCAPPTVNYAARY